jgi:hydroxymethylpyrimidine/phosphomethylpyrimidine kinase
LHPDAIDGLRKLVSHARVVTPNLPEAAALLDTSPARDETEMHEQAKELLALGAGAVLIKGGHGSGPESIDLLVEAGSCERFAAPRAATLNTHGTGCTFAAAVTAGLDKGQELNEAVRLAKAYVSAAINAADRLKVGSGRGPLHHFHLWY